MIRRVLRHIRRQPREVRESYAFFSALTVALCIGAVWAVQLPDRLSNIGAIDTQVPMADTVSSEGNPLPFSHMISRIQASVVELSWGEDSDEVSLTPQTSPTDTEESHEVEREQQIDVVRRSEDESSSTEEESVATSSEEDREEVINIPDQP